VVLFNYATMQMTAKIVYYGPGLCGKTTNLHWIHQRTAPGSRGEMVSLETETDRTLFFDLLPLEVGVIGGMKVRLQLYTVPGQVFYNATRKLVLKGVDGVVFVADSQAAMLDANIESLSNLKANLAELGLGYDHVPVVFQFNKRDLRNILPVTTLSAALNPEGLPSFEAAALHGIGVFETLKTIAKLAVTSVRKKVASDAPARPAPADPAAPSPIAELEAAAAAPAATTSPLAAIEDLVEFAEEDTGSYGVRPVKTRGQVDIQGELEKLRAIAAPARPAPAARAPKSDVEKRLMEMVSPAAGRQEIKRKATVEVPAEALRGGQAVTVQLVFGEGDPHGAVTIPLAAGTRLDRLLLRLDIDVKAKP
jgi:signal recognition particle receptor subunit beta